MSRMTYKDIPSPVLDRQKSAEYAGREAWMTIYTRTQDAELAGSFYLAAFAAVYKALQSHSE
jgi:hypothetical protein